MNLIIAKITITRKYEKYNQNAENVINWKNIKNRKMLVGFGGLGKPHDSASLGENPGSLAEHEHN